MIKICNLLIVTFLWFSLDFSINPNLFHSQKNALTQFKLPTDFSQLEDSTIEKEFNKNNIVLIDQFFYKIWSNLKCNNFYIRTKSDQASPFENHFKEWTLSNIPPPFLFS